MTKPCQCQPDKVELHTEKQFHTHKVRDAMRDATYGAMNAERFVVAHHLRNEVLR